MTLHSSTENSLAVFNHKILEANSQVQNVKFGGHQTCLSINRFWHELCECCAILLEPQLLDIMIVQFRNEKVSNHGSIPITIDCNFVAFIVFEEGFHQPIKRTKQPTTDVPPAPCHDEFRGPLSDYVRQCLHGMGGTINSNRAARPLVRLVEREEKREALDPPQSVLFLYWGGTDSNRTVTCMVLKATANDRPDIALYRDEFLGPQSVLCQSGSISNNYKELKCRKPPKSFVEGEVRLGDSDPFLEWFPLKFGCEFGNNLSQLWRIDEHNVIKNIKKCYDVNQRLTYGMRAIGKGGAAARILLKNSMNAAVHEAVIANDNNSNIAVAVDGTWHKRGYSSLNGVVCATSLSVENGKVIDFEALTKYCSSCKGKKTM
ncbi:uncharacterized protein TNCV_3745141 [Trichonephila clavipes]|nr:uncharacterized protein TNCV_3745141 [Trichonephila clavipes]